MVETALPPVAAASIVIDLIGDLDARLGDIAASALRRLDPDRRVILSLKHLTTVHSDGFTALVNAVKVHVSFGRTISIVSNGAKTRALLAEASLGEFVVSQHAADEEPTVRRLLLARHAK